MVMTRPQLVGAIMLAVGVALVCGFLLRSRQPYSPTSSYAERIDYPEVGDHTMSVSIDNCGGSYSSGLTYLPDRIEVSIVQLGTSRGREFWRDVRGVTPPSAAPTSWSFRFPVQSRIGRSSTSSQVAQSHRRRQP